jgi:hypothetical protein
VGALGCSTIERRVFYTPSAEGGVLEREPSCADAGGRVLSGPADQIVVGASPLRIEAQAPVKQRDISVGPFVLPIVPVFFLGWLFPSAFGTGDEGQPLRVDLRVVEAAGIVRLETGGIVATIAPEGAPVPASKLDDFVDTAESRTGGLRTRGSWSAHFGPPRRSVESFRLELQGVRVDGRPVEFPPIDLKRASGWLYCDNF